MLPNLQTSPPIRKSAIKQLRSEGELLAQNGQFRGAIDSLDTAIKMLGLKDRLYLNIPLKIYSSLTNERPKVLSGSKGQLILSFFL